MSRSLILSFLFLVFSLGVSYAKPKPPLSLQINPSTNKATINEPIILSAAIKSDLDFDSLNVDWKFEGNVELVSGDTKTVLTGVKAGSVTNSEITVKFGKLEGAKVILAVHQETPGGHFGQTQIYVPGLAAEDSNNKSSKAKSSGKHRRIFN